MQAIEVKQYMDANGNSKVKAKCDAGSRVFYRSDLERIAAQKQMMQGNDTYAILAAKALAQITEWDNQEYYGKMVMGQLTNGNYVFVFTGREDKEIIK